MLCCLRTNLEMSDGTDSGTIFSKAKGLIALIAGVSTIVGGTIAGIQYYHQRSIPDISGRWKITNTVEETTYNPYQGLELEYKVFISQDGVNLDGRGEKLWENGQLIERQGRSPIQITGRVEGGRVSATFREQGLRRRTSGHFDWQLAADGDTLKGTFTHTAASMSGPSVAVKVED